MRGSGCHRPFVRRRLRQDRVADDERTVDDGDPSPADADTASDGLGHQRADADGVRQRGDADDGWRSRGDAHDGWWSRGDADGALGNADGLGQRGDADDGAAAEGASGRRQDADDSADADGHGSQRDEHEVTAPSRHIFMAPFGIECPGIESIEDFGGAVRGFGDAVLVA